MSWISSKEGGEAPLLEKRTPTSHFHHSQLSCTPVSITTWKALRKKINLCGPLKLNFALEKISIMKAFVCVVFALLVSSGYAQKKTQEDPCKAKGKIVGDATYCDRYWECVDDKAELFDCPNGLVFAGRNRGIAENCDYPWRGNYCEDKQLANPPISNGPCDWQYGIFGHETSCTRYWTCWNGTAVEQFCIGGLLYNEEQHACDWPQNVEGCQKHPLCKDDPNGNVPLGKSCTRYWSCQGGYPRLQRCPATLVFDKRTLRCVNPPTEDCEVLPTPAPDADEKPAAAPQAEEDEEEEEESRS